MLEKMVNRCQNLNFFEGIVANQPVRFNPVMVVEQSRGGAQQFAHQPPQQAQQPQQQAELEPVTAAAKMTQSPRPSILRKRDHDGIPLKAAKNLNSSFVPAAVPAAIPARPLRTASSSPPPRPDSRDNGNSSGAFSCWEILVSCFAKSILCRREHNDISNIQPGPGRNQRRQYSAHIFRPRQGGGGECAASDGGDAPQKTAKATTVSNPGPIPFAKVTLVLFSSRQDRKRS